MSSPRFTLALSQSDAAQQSNPRENKFDKKNTSQGTKRLKSLFDQAQSKRHLGKKYVFGFGGGGDQGKINQAGQEDNKKDS